MTWGDLHPIEQRQPPALHYRRRLITVDDLSDFAELLDDVAEVYQLMDFGSQRLLGEPCLEQVPHLGRAIAEQLDFQPRLLAQEHQDVARHPGAEVLRISLGHPAVAEGVERSVSCAPRG